MPFNTITNIIVDDDGALFSYSPSLFNKEESATLFEKLTSTVPYEYTTYVLDGINIRSPRKMAWFANHNWTYQFSKNHIPGLPAHAWTDAPVVTEIKSRVEEAIGLKFNCALVNIYQNGGEFADWHSDDDPWLGDLSNTTIASVSFGNPRIFAIQPKDNPNLHNGPIEIELESGSLAIMSGNFQQRWQHSLPPSTTKQCSSRINITFRQIRHPELKPVKKFWNS